MRKISQKYFDELVAGHALSTNGEIAKKLINDFINGGYNLAEVETSDFQNEFDFSKKEERNKVRCYLNYQLRRMKLTDEISVVGKSCRLFLKRK